MKNLMWLASFALIISCTAEQEQEKESPAADTAARIVSLTEAQIKNAGVVTGKAERKNISAVLRVNGVVDIPPQNMASISAPLGGYLKETNLLPGMHVHKGESLAVMEDAQYIQLQQDYLTSKSKLAFSESEYNRQKELNQSKAASDKALQLALSDYTSQKVIVKSLSEKLKLIGINPETLSEENLSKNISVYSPIDGYVSKINAGTGKYVKPEDVMFEIINFKDVHLALNIFEKDINRLFIGQKLIAYTNNNPEKKYACEIILIGKNFSADRSVEVHCHFEDYDDTLIPGMFMNAEIEIKKSNTYVLPSESIVSFEGKQYVFIAKTNDTFEPVEIKAGNAEGGFTEIMDDSLNLTGRVFVIKGAYSLLMKMKNAGEE